MLTFHKVPNGTAASDNLSQRLIDELQASKRVLWLLGGGSNIPLSVEIMNKIPAELQSQLTVALTDERYGDFDHADSNARQLREAGFTIAGAQAIMTLSPDNLSLEDTVKAYGSALGEAIATHDVVVAQLGIGPDGHVCGILPHSPAVNETGVVAGYDATSLGSPFVRITMTPTTMRSIHYAFAFAFGESKHEALQALQSQNLSLEEQPAQILKELPEAHLFSDQVEQSETTVESPITEHIEGAQA